ncbi:SIR2 family protein [Paenibacillus odorifer]|uniref:SIR2 family protein n=1 Tax=Paenibacillus odorifer TaxID=189426 RepID=UPI00289D0F60|nr:SIR2 family protein [Paenibacillus odorifer]
MKAIILGAGASKAYDGSPTKIRMPVAIDFFKTYNKLEISQNSWVLVGEIINYLNHHHQMKPEEFVNYSTDVEVLHSEIEEKLLHAFNDSQDFVSLRESFKSYNQLVFLFTSVINEIQNGPVSEPHKNLAKLLKKDDVIITFNWDTLMDRALAETTEWTPDAGYFVTPKMIYRNAWEPALIPQKTDYPKLIKLHGSTNWLSSATTIENEKIIMTQSAGPETFYIFESTIDPYDTYNGRYMSNYEPYSYGYYPPNIPDPGKPAPEDQVFVRLIPRFPHMPIGTAGKSGLTSMSLIIPPVKHKTYDMYGYLFKELWREAELCLTEASEIIIIGYSFPVTDIQSNHLFENAFMKRKTVPRITIVDPNPHRIKEKFSFEFGIPDDHLVIHQDYFSKDFPIDKLF